MKVNFIDNGDSFADMIAAYLTIAGADVVMHRSNCSLDTSVRRNPDLIVLGPGPNGPREAGNYMELLDRYHKELPFFGICLGFQAMMEYFGQPVGRLDDIVHGAKVPVDHNGTGIFDGIIRPADFARYNSLGVYAAPEPFEITATYNHIVMAARHKCLPIEGVQFHPESVLSMANDNGIKLFQNVLKNLAAKNHG